MSLPKAILPPQLSLLGNLELVRLTREESEFGSAPTLAAGREELQKQTPATGGLDSGPPPGITCRTPGGLL